MIEIQIHPSDIRRRVRYFFLDRRRVVAGVIALSIILALMIGSMAAAPTVIRRVYKTNFLNEQRMERDIQRERLRENVVQMSSLERSLEEQRIRVEKLITVYGLDRSLGQGGFSTPIRAGRPAEEPLDDAQHREVSLKNAMRRLQEQIDILARYEAANADIVRHTPSILPLPADQFVLTSPFGNRVSPFTRTADFHKGLDLSAPTGTSIYAAAEGVVPFAVRLHISPIVNWRAYGHVVTLYLSQFLA